MKKYLKDFLTADFIKFVLVGGFAAGVNFLSRILLNSFMTYAYAIFGAYMVGMVVAFVLNRLLVFNAKDGRTSKQLSYFALVNIVAVIQTIIVSILFANYIFPLIGVWHWRAEIAHFIGISIPIFTSFLGHKYFSFSDNN